MADIKPITTTTSVTKPGSTEQVTEVWSIDLGDIMWPLSIMVGAVLLFLAFKGRFFPGLRMKNGGKEIEVGGTKASEATTYVGPDRRNVCMEELDVRAIQIVELVARRRTEASNRAWARQLALIDEVLDDFHPVLNRRLVDPWQNAECRNRFKGVLDAIANFNHILEVVQDGQVNHDYLAEKVGSFRRRYEKLHSWPEAALPSFNTIEEEVRALMAQTLTQFAVIAREEEARLRDFAETVKSTTNIPDLKTIIDETALRSLEA